MDSSTEIVRESHDSRLCHVGVLYGGRWPEDGAMGTIYELLIGLFGEIGLTIDYMQVRAPGFGKAPLAFTRADTRLRKSGLESLDHAELFATQPGGTQPIYEWQAEGALARHNGLVYFAAIEEPGGRGQLYSLLAWSRVVAECKPAYGIIFKAPRKVGPGYYARGLNFGNVGDGAATGDIYRAKLRISRWADKGRKEQVWSRGILRDIYPQNLLTESHLSYPVDGQSFAEWVKSTGDRGRMTDYVGGMTLWEISADERDRVGPALLKAGMLFNPYHESWESFRLMFPEPTPAMTDRIEAL